jgi:excisionase family DNA binding protein
MTFKTDTLRADYRAGAALRRALRVNDACIALGIHRATCYRWMKSGALPFAEIAGIRFVRVSDIEKLLEPTAA